MSKRADRSVGLAIFIVSILGFMAYAWLLLASEWGMIVLQLTVLAAVAGLLGILAWIGLTMATTPSPSVEQEPQVMRGSETDEEQEIEPALSKE